MTSRRDLVFGVAALFAGAGAVRAQKKEKQDPNVRNLQGVVFDSAENAVSGAIVQLKDTKTLQVRSFITQDKGEYHFAGLSTNVDYEIRAEHNGTASSTKKLSVFDSRKLANINLKLEKK
jgi:hypothetical protein